MGTTGYPILSALRDVGGNIRSALESQAASRQADLQAQQQTNQMTLQQALIANQAKVQESQAALDVAKTGEQQRQFNVTASREQQRATDEQVYRTSQQQIERERLKQTGDYQAGQQEIARRQLEEQGEYHRGALAIQGRTADTAAAHLQLERERLATEQGPDVYAEDLIKEGIGAAVRKKSPEDVASDVASTQAAADNVHPEYLGRVDPANGKHILTWKQAMDLTKLHIEIAKLNDAEKPLSDAERLRYTIQYANDMAKATPGRPFDEVYGVASAVTGNNKEYTRRIQAIKPDLDNARARDMNDVMLKNGAKHDVTPDDIQQFRREHPEAAGFDDAHLDDVPAWHKFRQEKLVAYGGKRIDATTDVGKKIQAQLNGRDEERTWQAKQRIANDINGGPVEAPAAAKPGAVPQGAPSAAPTTGTTAGPLSQRLNNPLNIKQGGLTQHWVDQGKATVGPPAQDGGKFLHFTSPEDGREAARELLDSDAYTSLTVDQAMKKWSNKGYGAEIVRGVIPPDTKMADLDEEDLDHLVKAMERAEGGGSAQVRPGAAPLGAVSRALSTVGGYARDVVRGDEPVAGSRPASGPPRGDILSGVRRYLAQPGGSPPAVLAPSSR